MQLAGLVLREAERLSAREPVWRRMARTHHSPFRLPLYRYLNRYPPEIWAFLLSKIENPKYGRFFTQVLSHPDSQRLRDYASLNIESLIKICNGVITDGKETRTMAIINTVGVLHALSQYPNTSSWMSNKEHIEWLKQIGKDLERSLKNHALPTHLRLPADQAAEQLMTLLTKALEQDPKDLRSPVRAHRVGLGETSFVTPRRCSPTSTRISSAAIRLNFGELSFCDALRSTLEKPAVSGTSGICFTTWLTQSSRWTLCVTGTRRKQNSAPLGQGGHRLDQYQDLENEPDRSTRRPSTAAD